mmetsp:Transcript_46492/g.88776  ORF Transcript_46492/g.88776 Transcript_46492/m.88776 type:complete len:86 (-) Transcript_46492:235-492(-)|eukprot:CAMPEP_0114256280 /NCGR_PEP_ID=MMETSP0058-20121206/18059_1 /TAXON_ID=36894 /ORGANISM="Pyramimonas parkeae, CCMP726" /LENGTH=85 /DNA_ID=CAMNT_0001370817 /DNA_START=131 /DNA_END=388 /DNA_ORIENTATION=+
MWLSSAQFPALVPHTPEPLVSEQDEDAALAVEEERLEAQWKSIREAHTNLRYPGMHSTQVHQTEVEPVEEDDEEIEEESEGDDFE